MNTDRIIAGHYKITERLAYDGMGGVFRGVDIQTNTDIVLKLIREEFLTYDPTLIERLSEEAQQIRQLNHPNILDVQTIISEDHEHFIIMRYLSGGTLRDLLQNKSYLPDSKALEITHKLASGLAAIHSIGIYHNDLKPDNVLFDEHGEPYLTDFSMAFTNPDKNPTLTGMVIGTLAYLSPEAINLNTTDERADIWALGIMLYEMIAGQRPFIGESINSLLTDILSKQPDGFLDSSREIHWAIWELVKWMLEKEREQRIPSATIVKQAVTQILNGVFTPPPINSADYAASFREKVMSNAT